MVVLCQVLVSSIMILLVTSLVHASPRFGGTRCDYGKEDAQVLIFGAGLAGLGAAQRLSENGIDDFLILEQRDRIGGRVQSVQFGGTTVELGPQWVLNANLELPPEEQMHPLVPLIERCNITLRDAPLGSLGSVFYNSDGEDFTQSPELAAAIARYLAAQSPEVRARIFDALADGEDLTVASGLREGGWNARTPIEQLVQLIFFESGPARSIETVSYRESFDQEITEFRGSFFGFNSSNYVVTDERGYIAIAECLADEFLAPNDERLILESTVDSVQWGDKCVCANATKDGEEREYCAPYAILTFSTGVLSNGGINFIPELPIFARLNLQKLEMSNFLKMYVLFNETFWDTGKDFIWYLDEINGEEYYSWIAPWGDFFPNKPPVLQFFLISDTALRIAYQDIETTRNQIGTVLQNIYGERASDPVDIIMNDFITNPYFFGEFSTSNPGTLPSTRKELSHPFADRLYFSGEALSQEAPGSTHGALFNGYQTGERVAQRLVGPLKVKIFGDTPIVNGNSVAVLFVLSRDADLVQCAMSGGKRVNCSSRKEITFSNMEPGEHVLRIIARNSLDDRTSISRRIFVGGDTHCAVNLINAGMRIFGDNAKIEFKTNGLPVTEVTCKVDDSVPFTCKSPLELSNLGSGRHRVTITPYCDGSSAPYSQGFNID